MKMDDHLLFDVFTTEGDRLVRSIEGVSLIAARALAGLEDAHDFDNWIEATGWCGTTPAWSGFKPVVVVPKGQLLRIDQFKFIHELAG